MGANLNKNENSFFILNKPGWSSGAIATGLPGYAESLMPMVPVASADPSSAKYTWLICPHLSKPELVFQYYLASGLITVVLGKCFCESCLDRILSGTDLADLIDACRPMTDRIFQENFVSPLIDSNSSFNQLIGAEKENGNPPKTGLPVLTRLHADPSKRPMHPEGNCSYSKVFLPARIVLKRYPPTVWSICFTKARP